MCVCVCVCVCVCSVHLKGLAPDWCDQAVNKQIKSSLGIYRGLVLGFPWIPKSEDAQIPHSLLSTSVGFLSNPAQPKIIN